MTKPKKPAPKKPAYKDLLAVVKAAAKRVKDDRGPKNTWKIERRCKECECYWHPAAGEFEIHTMGCLVGRARRILRGSK